MVKRTSAQQAAFDAAEAKNQAELKANPPVVSNRPKPPTTVRTPEQQAQFDAAELVNQSRLSRPAQDHVELEVQDVIIGNKAKLEGEINNG